MAVRPSSQQPTTTRFTDRHVRRGIAYAQAVISGEIAACSWVRLACQRHLDDLERWRTAGPYAFDERVAGQWCQFIELMPHIKGPLAGENIRLEDWQCFLLTAVFGWLRRGTTFRRFRRVYTEVPRGNAKSTISSALGLKAAFADGEGGAEVYSAAVTRDQARIVFAAAQQMARRRPDMCSALGVEVLAHAISQVKTASTFQPVASESNALDGLNVYLALIDELHAHRTREVYDTLETGTGKRPQSMLWTITTAGSNRAGICYEIRTYATRVLNGVVSDDSFWGIIYSIDDGDDWTAEATWRKANPNFGISVMPEVIAQLCAKAMEMPAAQASFKTKHLNVWVNADQAWMDMAKWRACTDPGLSPEDFAGEPCWVGLDLASKVDIASRALLFRRMQGDEAHFYLFMRHFLPEAAVMEARNSQYQGWEIDGWLTTTPGQVLDFSLVEADLHDISSRFQAQEVAYDPWQATQMATNMAAKGATMVEYRNTVANFSAPMKEIDALVRSGRLHFPADPVMEWMVSNVVCHIDAKDNIYPRKETVANKIDGVVAAIMALGRATAAPAVPVFTSGMSL